MKNCLPPLENHVRVPLASPALPHTIFASVSGNVSRALSSPPPHSHIPLNIQVPAICLHTRFTCTQKEHPIAPPPPVKWNDGKGTKNGPMTHTLLAIDISYIVCGRPRSAMSMSSRVAWRSASQSFRTGCGGFLCARRFDVSPLRMGDIC